MSEFRFGAKGLATCHLEELPELPLSSSIIQPIDKLRNETL